MSLLEKVNGQQDLKQLNIAQLTDLAEEIRKEIIGAVDDNGGHLSANLGIVETSIAVNYVFDLPKDKVLYDVGHQCYTHKLLTDRKEKFSSIRTFGGLSGFMNACESEYDCVTTGHAGSSLATGLGYALARDQKKENYNVVTVIGDGSIANGLALEALTSSRQKPQNFIVILNDNGMSISQNNGGLYNLLSQYSVRGKYIKAKNAFKKVFGESVVTKFFRKVRGGIKRILNPWNIFEKFGFKYVGIIDGNDMESMVSVLRRIKQSKKAVLLHIRTVKGKGFEPAENNPRDYHGVGKQMQIKNSTFSLSVSQTLGKFASKDDSVNAITAGMTCGTGLSEFSKSFPTHFWDVGICEEYAVTLAGGMARGGLKPVVCIYSTFLERAYDQIVQDVCIDNLPVVFLVDRFGISGKDGKTHQGTLGYSFLRHIPNLTVLAPSTVKEFEQMLGYAFNVGTPTAICYPNGDYRIDERLENQTPFNAENLWSVVGGKIESCEKVLLACGRRMLDVAIKANEKTGNACAVINARTVKPLDEKLLCLIKDKKIITLEDNVVAGGFGSAVNEYYASKKISVSVQNLGVDDRFVEHGSVEELLKQNNLDVDSVEKIVKS